MKATSHATVGSFSSDDTFIQNQRSAATAGFAIGILHINSNYPLIIGNAQNAATFDFPVRYQQVDGLSPADLLSGSDAVTEHVVQAAQLLQDAGVGAVVGACGSFINYQSAIADALEIPIFSSVLITAPLLLSSLGKNKKLGVIFASSESFTEKVRKQCGLPDTDRLVIADCRELSAFRPILNNKNYLNSAKLEEQLVDLAAVLVRENPDIGILMLQCSELPPYARSIQEAIGVPVFDVTNLIGWVHNSIVQKVTIR